MSKARRLIYSVAGLILAAGTLLSTVPSASAAAAAGAAASGPSEATGLITNYGSGKCFAPVAPPGGSINDNGALVQQITCDGSPSQTWTLQPQGRMSLGNHGSFNPSYDVWHIVNQSSGRCMDDKDGQEADRSPVQQWGCTASTTMDWVIFRGSNGASQVVNWRTLKDGIVDCLDVAAGSLADGAQLQLYGCSSTDTSINPAQFYFMPS